ncbi:MAG TPA: tryptophan halogenase family protein [Steroidobacteraceae bacterium]|nr:tryptophan halogenase family protein [Steroidobacteraceae bacterium]
MTDDLRIRRVAIVGGGTAGWLAANVLARALPAGPSITVVESPEIGTIGVGEATIPPFMELLRFLDIDEADFVRRTGATYKLGIRYRDWRRLGHVYWHPFGTLGTTIDRRPFYHHWHKARAAGRMPRVIDYSVCAALGTERKFRFPAPADRGSAAGVRYALHFDAGLVAGYLRQCALERGVTRIERTVVTATQRPDGFIDELVFADGGRLGADLYIDCSGFRGVLIEQVLETGYVDWRQLLPCDRAVAVATRVAGPRPPYTQATARRAGWHWRIPLQHRIGNGYVYSSAHSSDTEALEDLLGELGEPLAEPRLLKFTAGRRRSFWSRNCVALGLASGFLEPLESTSIQLVVSGLYNLLDHFPDRAFDQANIDSYNTELIEEIERIRDFLILHYCRNQRDDAPFWQECRAARLPESLQQRIDLYRGTGRIRPGARELFTDLSWFFVFEGLGVEPAALDPLADEAALARAWPVMQAIRADIEREVRAAPSHDSYFVAAGALSPARASGSTA